MSIFRRLNILSGQLTPSSIRSRGYGSSAAMTFTLPSGATIPVPGFGTGTKWYKPGDPSIDRRVVDAIVSALKLGYRHIDGAEVYGTEGEIGVAIKESGIPRDQIFVTSKILPKIGNPRAALEETLKLSQLDYLDLYLIHAPFVDEKSHGISLEKAWEVLSELKSEGKVREIGVSNFAIADLERLKGSKEKVAVNQIEFNPYLQNQTPGIVEYCQANGILVEAYTPLGPLFPAAKGGPLDPVVHKLATKYGRDAGQIILKWTIQRGIIPITTSAKEERQKSNLDLNGFELTAEEVKEIDEAGSQKHFRSYWTDKYIP
ncbi:NADP-dependent oxidoreductase domain-containing protein [Lipomyces kononenkoae]|uniref:NADP-dependent oxidoreductase domain-containing protein n=1 Tax=Lipomyces kononenkoae TaxID=34357 RepID=A0ACC3SZF5_LIPKO